MNEHGRLRLMEAALAASVDGVIVVDAAGEMVFMNEAGRRIAERSPSAHRPVEEQAEDYRLRYPDGRPVPPEETPLGRALRGDTVTDVVLLLGLADGTDAYISNSASPVRDQGGAIIGAVSVFRDVTERKRAEEALRASEAKYRNLFENMAEEVHFWQLVRDEEGRIETWRLVDANPQTLKTWGRTLDEIVGKTTEEIFGPGATEHYIPVVQKIMTEGVPYSFEDYFPHLDKYFRFTSVPLGDYFITTGADITSIEKAHEALGKSEAKYRAVFQSLVEGVVFLNPQGEVEEANDAVQRLHGHSPRELMDPELDPRWRIIRPDGTPFPVDEQPAIVVLRTGEAVRDVEMGVPTGDGSLRWRLVNAQPVYDDRGNLFGAVASFFDITERKRAEQERERLLAELEATLQAAAAGVAAFDTTGRIVRLNDAAERILGLSPDDLALPMAELVARLRFETAEGAPVPLADFPPARALRGERVGSMVMSCVRGGCRVWIYDGAGPIRASDGTILGAVVSFVDVTELRDLQEQQRRLLAELQARAAELAFERDRLRILIESIADAVFVCDAEGNITLANQAGLALIGLGRAETIGTLADYLNILQLRTPDGRPVPLEDLSITRALQGEVTRGREELATHPRTQRSLGLSVSAAPLRDESGRVVGAISTLRDITERVEYDRLKDEFLVVAAHELKTPVAIMKGYAQALLRTTEEVSPRRRKMLEAVDRGADRIEGVVNDLLDISRLLAGSLELASERIDIAEMVEEVADRMALAAPKHVVQVLTGAPVVVYGDRGRLEQVLVNLLDNAIRYSPQGGDVDVEVAVQGREVVVSVTDRGVGIPREKQGRIFQQFYRAHTMTPYDYGGMGVGLYISKEIVERHGGRMWFASEEDKGSTFSFSVPLGGSGGDR